MTKPLFENTQARGRKRPRQASAKSVSGRADQRKRPLPLAGKLVAVSTLSDAAGASGGGNDDDENDKSRSSPTSNTTTTTTLTTAENYNTIVALCQSAGAQCTGAVHKRVHCVVATDRAVAHATQRVRKAWKRGVVVVRVTWLHDCMTSGRCLPTTDYVLSAPPPMKAKVPSGSSKKPKDDLDNVTEGCGLEEEEDFHESEYVQKVDLGCCCVCHETGDTNCQWCVDCTVAKQPPG